LFHYYVRPPKRRKIPEKAVSIHGITLDRLRNEPTMADIHNKLRLVLSKKIVIAYNAEFDKQMLAQTLKKYDLPAIKNKFECAMLKYTAYMLEERWVKLPGAGHDTITDCNAVRKILNEMASRAI
jgi:DNA polymerase-3 subunit epsilon